ncbi:hypothetical protein JXM83_07075, partial [Candidatus Woesearchaeota archaeon]|nr:hypothetical protein [Candidatus Woesearchaeota archaeon]
MKKILILFAFVLVAFGVVACDKTTTTTTTAATTTEAGTTQSTTTNEPVKEIVLSYADWGDAELNQVLIDAFEAKYPNITV